MTAPALTHSRPERKRTLEDLSIPSGEYPFAYGYIASAHTAAIEQLDLLLAHPGDKRSLLQALKAIRDGLADDVEYLHQALARRVSEAAR